MVMLVLTLSQEMWCSSRGERNVPTCCKGRAKGVLLWTYVLDSRYVDAD